MTIYLYIYIETTQKILKHCSDKIKRRGKQIDKLNKRKSSYNRRKRQKMKTEQNT